MDSGSGKALDTTASYNTGYIVLISLVAALGGLLFGYDWVVIGGAKPFYEPYFQLHTETLVGWANSCALVGCLAGSILSGFLSGRFGRKKLLILSAILFAVSSALTGWAPIFSLFVTWRIAGGVAIGIASNVSPMYIAEVGPAPWRGRLVALNQLTIVLGILAAQIVNWLIAQPVAQNATAEMIRQSWNGQFGWRWMFTAVCVPSVIFFFSALFVPESPRWLVQKGQNRRALETLARIGGGAYGEQAIREIRDTIGSEPSAGIPWSDLLHPSILKILSIGVALAVLQQWSGINVIFNYAEEIYRGAGYGVSGILFNIVITGAVNVVFSIVALGFVDKVGRRALMLLGCAGIAVSHLMIGIAYSLSLKGLPVLILTLCAIGCYSMSLAPVTWVLISEIFPNRIRGAAISISVSALWTACFILTFTFPVLNAALGTSGTFWLYSAICFTGFCFILWRVPETKSKTLEQIEHELTGTKRAQV
ncbi:MAG TPA: sugar porter family MFS transporter [Bryobacteraceae bacterium]|nr:sugar porter family MFS transporter [Bryobacteraceae bacterium]